MSAKKKTAVKQIKRTLVARSPKGGNGDAKTLAPPPAPPPADAVLAEQLGRLHQIEGIGKQVSELDKKIVKAAADEDDAKDKLRAAREAIKALNNDRDDLVTEQTMLSLGKFSERLAFPPPPEMAKGDTGAQRDRLAAIATKLMQLPDRDEPDFSKLNELEKKHVPKKRQALIEEAEKLISKLKPVVSRSMVDVVIVPGVRKAEPLLHIQVVEFSDGKWASQWSINPNDLQHIGPHLPELDQSLGVVPDGVRWMLDELYKEKQFPNDSRYTREVFNQREAAVRLAVAQIRGDAPNPQHPGIVLSFTARIGGRPTPLKFVCDHFANWKDNLRAIALTLERLRLADLYGVTKSGEQYTGWRALPAPLVTPPPMTLEYAAQLMATHSDDFGADLIASDGSAFSAAYRQAVKKVHPDAGGGDDEAWEQLQQAKTVLEAHYQSR